MDAAVRPFAPVRRPPFRPYADGPTFFPEPPESLLALSLASWAGAGPTSVLHVARSETRADRLARAASSFAPELEVLFVPPWDCSPYDRASPSCSIIGRRVAALERLVASTSPNGRLVVTTVETLLQRLPPRSIWAGARLELAADRPTEDLKIWLISNGYVLDERVDEPGEVAFRGEVIDIFPSSGAEPVRIELADGRIGRMRRYDPVDQRTTAEVDSFVLHPASEVPLAQDLVRSFLEGTAEEASDGLAGSPERPQRASGLEHRLPAFYEELETLFDYLPDAVVSFDPEVEERRNAALEQILDGYATRAAIHGNGSAGRALCRSNLATFIWTRPNGANG